MCHRDSIDTKGIFNLKIFTHQHLDLDAASAVSLFLLSNQNYHINNVHFVSAEYNGPMGPDDIAIDIFAGTRGIKGHESSAFSEILNMIAPKYDPAFRPMATFIDAHDSSGDWKAVYGLPKSFNVPTILDFFRGYQRAFPGQDATLLRTWFAYIRGLWLSHQDFQKAKKLVNKKNDKITWVKDQHTVLVVGKVPQQVFSLLFDKGARFVVYERENTMGIMRAPKETTHIGSKIEWMLPDWFHHPSGFLSCWGTVKCPKDVHCGQSSERIAEYVSSFK